LGAMNISNEESESLSRMFTDLYMANEEMYPELSEDEIYDKTMIAFSEKLKQQQQQKQQPSIAQ
uniref:ARF-like 2-binding protein n=1 Tax=Gongylonema pulchrum TaxID=637853 RepID=A0A183EBL2_9BILA